MKEMIYKSERTIDVLEDSTYKKYHYVVLSLGTHPCGYVEVTSGRGGGIEPKILIRNIDNEQKQNSFNRKT